MSSSEDTFILVLLFILWFILFGGPIIFGVLISELVDEIKGKKDK